MPTAHIIILQMIIFDIIGKHPLEFSRVYLFKSCIFCILTIKLYENQF